ncbi:SNF related kinase b [Corythoichthys intestinalis]|uniref:SNF related kinase b n=1 Tax=Corythoichthys intestinalis TaxID=161448 RepID=UPI0025A507E4|nr:SNF related kinase b [Corythoichthys intestinalis]XP_057692340.1 SNF related kinase b [Corythoichthys intestinalis]XP_057692341.1 SNF related kinase b [Corythoichthys intestinalis]XP_061813036.1 serine/threonine-protein kinase MARK1-like [Nerophis lumbriciformis]
MDCGENIPPLDEDLKSNRLNLNGLYHVGRTLGRGHYAVVKLARHVNTGQLVAIKMIDKTKLDVMATSHLLQEVRCMRRVQHPNVVRLYEVIDTPTTLYLVMELAEGGDLYDYILRHETGVAEGTAKRHFAQIVRAVAYCHELHVVHRDLKPENVVFFPQQGAVKLTDFGFSNLFKPGTMLATSCGSLAYSAPEILLGEEYDAPAVDIWSLGVILYMLVCGVPPFQETNDSETLVMILDCRYSIPERVSSDCRDLISRMLQKDPSLRASLQEIEAHHWLQGLDNVLLSPEAPPHWLSGALSSTSPLSRTVESGDLLAAKSQSLPAPRQVNFTYSLHPPPVEEPPVTKNLPALLRICEEEEEEEEEEESNLAKESEGLLSLLVSEPQKDTEVALEGADNQEERVAKLGRIEEMLVEDEDKAETEVEHTRSACVISYQPVGHADNLVSPAPEPPAPREAETGLRVPCCQGWTEPASPEKAHHREPEPNNNRSAACATSQKQKTSRIGKKDQRTDTGARNDFVTDRSQSHNATGSWDEGAARVEPAGKRHSLKLRERLFQLPLCEKALAFNIPTNNKAKILPLAQYNCCHVL